MKSRLPYSLVSRFGQIAVGWSLHSLSDHTRSSVFGPALVHGQCSSTGRWCWPLLYQPELLAPSSAADDCVDRPPGTTMSHLFVVYRINWLFGVQAKPASKSSLRSFEKLSLPPVLLHEMSLTVLTRPAQHFTTRHSQTGSSSSRVIYDLQ